MLSTFPSPLLVARLLGARRLVATAGLALVATSCAGGTFVESRPFPFTQYIADGPLEAVGPVDVLVAPVHNQSGVDPVPLEDLHRSLSAALVARLYSPLAPALDSSGDAATADAGTVEAGFGPTQAGADAILQVVVTGWDTRFLQSHNAILAEVEARLFDASKASRPVLWAVSLGRRLEVSSRMREKLPESEVWARMADQLAGDVLDLLPERNPLAN